MKLNRFWSTSQADSYTGIKIICIVKEKHDGMHMTTLLRIGGFLGETRKRIAITVSKKGKISINTTYEDSLQRPYE